MQSDYLFIKDLKVQTKIGVHNWEQAIFQRLHIDLEIPLNIANCDDKIENTLDYSKLCSLITEYIETRSFALIETVAETIATLIKENFKVTNLNVTVSKPNAVVNAGNIQIKISR